MKGYDLWRMSLKNLFAAPVRTTLTVLGIAIGIGAILAVLTLGDAGKSQVRSEMARLGIDRVWLTAAKGEKLSRGDGALLARELQTTATEQVYAPVSARRGDRDISAVAVGCTPEYLVVMDTRVVSGRALYPLEWEADGQSALLGQELARQLGATPGEWIGVGGVPLRCAGVVRQLNEMSQVDPGMAVFVPIAVFGRANGNAVHEITLSVPESVKPQALAAMAADVMEKKKGLAVDAVTLQVQIEAANSVMAIFVDVLRWVALICILVGGIGVMNILLVSVRERKREIGIMKSLGMTPWQICLLFLLEALLYALVGGVTGLAVGYWLIVTAGGSIGLSPVVKSADCGAVLLAALAVGLFFGVLPALRASAMHPVDALRDD